MAELVPHLQQFVEMAANSLAEARASVVALASSGIGVDVPG